jgi:hypothetical protein
MLSGTYNAISTLLVDKRLSLVPPSTFPLSLPTVFLLILLRVENTIQLSKFSFKGYCNSNVSSLGIVFAATLPVAFAVKFLCKEARLFARILVASSD